MNKVLGIIAEYNPFHNGHLYHLENSKKITGCEYTIAIISGNFTQRGSTSIVDKWQKTKMALSNGIDLVIELPTLYAISSSENFADGAIKILNALNIVDCLAFGAETNDISKLDKIANILSDEPIEYKSILSNELKKGISFPKSRENALSIYLNDNTYSDILSSPNNILGIEYLKALKKYKSSITPISINRIETDYNSLEFSNNISSATGIRNLIKNEKFDQIKNLVPANTYSVLTECLKNGQIITDLTVYEKEIIYILRKMTIKEISELPDVSEGLEFAIKNSANSCNDINTLINLIKSKRYTQSRIRRILLYALLGIKKSDMEISKNVLPYIRVLGFNENGKKLISKICKNNPELNVITSVKKFVDTNCDENLKLLLDKDIFASDVYSLGFKNNSIANLDFKNELIKN